MSAGDRGGVADLIQASSPAVGRVLLRARCTLCLLYTVRLCIAPTPALGMDRPPLATCLLWQRPPHAPASRSAACPFRSPPPIPVSALRLQTIHKSKIPIIAICNDKYSMKLR